MKRLLIPLIAVLSFSSPVKANSLTDLQIYSIATYRCLAQEKILSRQQITKLVQNDVKEDPRFGTPILNGLINGITDKDLKRQEKVMKEIGCKDMVISWIAAYFDSEKATELMVELAEKGWFDEE